MATPNNLNEAIRNLQTYLRAISFSDERIPRVPIDGLYDLDTQKAVTEFQSTRALPVTGTVDQQTWDAIYKEYKDIQRGTELLPFPNFFLNQPDNYEVDIGEKSSFAAIIQLMLRELSVIFDEIPMLEINGIYDENTAEAVRAFQRAALLDVTGRVDLETYNRLSRAFINGITY